MKTTTTATTKEMIEFYIEYNGLDVSYSEIAKRFRTDADFHKEVVDLYNTEEEKLNKDFDDAIKDLMSPKSDRASNLDSDLYGAVMRAVMGLKEKGVLFFDED